MLGHKCGQKVCNSVIFCFKALNALHYWVRNRAFLGKKHLSTNKNTPASKKEPSHKTSTLHTQSVYQHLSSLFLDVVYTTKAKKSHKTHKNCPKRGIKRAKETKRWWRAYKRGDSTFLSRYQPVTRRSIK